MQSLLDGIEWREVIACFLLSNVIAAGGVAAKLISREYSALRQQPSVDPTSIGMGYAERNTARRLPSSLADEGAYSRVPRDRKMTAWEHTAPLIDANPIKVRSELADIRKRERQATRRLLELSMTQVTNLETIIAQLPEQERTVYQRGFDAIYEQVRSATSKRWPELQKLADAPWNQKAQDKATDELRYEARALLLRYAMEVSHYAALETFVLSHPVLNALVATKA